MGKQLKEYVISEFMNEGGYVVSRLFLVKAASLMLITLVFCGLSVNVKALNTVEVKEKFVRTYVEVAKLGREGVDVKPLVQRLKEALEKINEGKVDDAGRILNDVSERLVTLKNEAPRILMMNSLEKYVSVAAILSIPLLTYFLLPRVYLELWFKARRKWVVEK